MLPRAAGLLILLLMPGSVAAQSSADQGSAMPAAPPQSSSSASSTSNPPANRPPASDPGYSIERIKKHLEQSPALTFTMPDPNVPRFQVRIEGPHFPNPSILESMRFPTLPVPMPFGGSDYYNMQKLITPPQYWGSAPFTNADLLKMAGLQGAYGLLGALVKKGIDARASAQAAAAHQEVLEELAALEAANAKAAKTSGDGDDGQKKAEKKKADAKKKGGDGS